VVLALLSPHGSRAHQPLEHQVKAAFLLNFTKFIEWPSNVFADDRSPLTICILGENPFAGALEDMVNGEVVNGRKLVLQTVRRGAPPEACRVLFISKSEKEVRKTLSAVGPGVLTVGEGENFLHEGGMIAFVVENRRVRFDIHVTAAANAMLTINARLLSVARTVEK
jgi:hypothetical protein